MTDYQKYINALRKCAKEHENDTTYTGHIIVSDLCRDTANLLEELKQEPILDKIRAEIDLDTRIQVKHYTNTDAVIDAVLDMIDEHKSESEE